MTTEVSLGLALDDQDRAPVRYGPDNSGKR